MTALEMHIEFDNRLQYLNSNRKLAVRSEMKDLIINQAILEATNNRLPSKLKGTNLEGQEDNQVLMDDLKELKDSAFLTAYYDSTITNCLYGVLPVDYYYLLNDKSLLEWNCNGVTYPTISSATVEYYKVAFPNDSAGSTRYNSFTMTMSISSVTTTIFDRSTYDTRTLYSSDAKFMIVQGVLDWINRTSSFSNGAGKTITLEAYWEYYDDEYQKDGFIIVVTSKTTGTTMGNCILNYDSAAQTTAIVSNKTRTYYNYSFTDTEEVPNRMVSSDVLPVVLKDHYEKTSYTSPVSALYGKRIRVYTNIDFIVSTINIDYYRKPRLINYAAGVSSDLNDKMQNEVIDIAVRKTKAMINDVNYQQMVLENQMSNK